MRAAGMRRITCWLAVCTWFVILLGGCSADRGSLRVYPDAKTIFHLRREEVTEIRYVHGSYNVSIDQANDLDQVVEVLNSFTYQGEPYHREPEESLSVMLGVPITVKVFFQDGSLVLFIMSGAVPGREGYIAFPPLEALQELHLGENSKFYQEYGDINFFTDAAFFSRLQTAVGEQK